MKQFEKRLIPAADWLAGILGLASLVCGGVFAFSLAKLGLGHLFGWEYSSETIREFIGAASHRTGMLANLLESDKAFLWLGIAVATGGISGTLIEFSTWAAKSPEERKRDRDEIKRRVEQERSEQAEKQAAAKAKRRPMSGWRRLWIVLSLLLGLPTGMIAFDNYSEAWAIVEYDEDNDRFWSAAQREPALSDCMWTTAKAHRYFGSYEVRCDTKDPFTPALLWALAPGFLMAAIGLTARWIYRGFKPKRGADEQA